MQARKEAASKAYLEDLRNREQFVRDRAAADRAAGRAATAPPKPWEL